MSKTLTSLQLPDDFPWGQTVGLLLDALHVESLIKRLYEWSPAPQVSVLYHGTRWAEISEISPCLVRLHDRDDPVLRQFLANTHAQWGYLIVSDGSWDELVAHVRWLTSIRPREGEEMFLRISDPAVARALFATEHYPCPELFGPCERIIAANAPLGEWSQFKRPEEKIIPHYGNSYIANDAQWEALKTAAFRQSMGDLYLHMQRFFPDYRTDLTPEQRLEHIYQLARAAVQKGFRAEQEIWLYANVLGFLGDDVLEQHPDIFELLTVGSEVTSLERVRRAAALAAERSAG